MAILMHSSQDRLEMESDSTSHMKPQPDWAPFSMALITAFNWFVALRAALFAPLGGLGQSFAHPYCTAGPHIRA